ncbi:hypothetical protein OE88DRAFT_235563 [Heliocybe sulcata]|uniref:Uncharacterized protein n=1 Tax=Heliocybe sulcata TaxID=5364 RepID=A0A5C3MZ44_9AGAM|nr:hypothetical protein OE88DRAFT_235563 [Heliocybe sulcata]
MSLPYGQSHTYPRPPPTSNNLTHHQRMHLLKSTTKLARVLGAPPKVVDVDIDIDSYEVYLHRDDDPIHVSLPAKHHRSHSVSSSSTHSSLPSPSSSSTKLAKAKRPTTHKPAYASGHRHPDDVLAAKLSSLSLEPTSFSPPIPSRPEIHLPTRPYSSSHRPSTGSSMPAKPQHGERDFLIETEQTQRRKKMDRVRRKLGEGVPVGMVFPSQDADEAESPLEERPPNYGSGEHGSGLFEDWGFAGRRGLRRGGSARA